MKKLICIVGETASGKDTIARIFKEKYGLKAVCSYTTREPRPGETYGEEHYFVSKEEFDKIRDTRRIVAYTKIESPKSGVEGYEYCTTYDECLQSDIYVIDPKGIEYLQSNFPEIQLSIIYIYADKDVRKMRALRRDPRGEKAFDDRYANEHEDFQRFMDEGDWNFLIENNSLSNFELELRVDNIMEMIRGVELCGNR